MSIRSLLKNCYLKTYHSGIFNMIPDNMFIPLQYKMATGKKLDINNAQSFNEKIQWMKLYDHNSIYTTIVDKYRVRKYVADRIGEKYLIPLLGVWGSPDEIEIERLPYQFVIKCNHDSGGISICKDKEKYNWEKEKKNISIHLKQNHYYTSREWAYKNVKPCVIAEKYMEDERTGELRDYKFFCFNGIPKYVQVDFGRFTNHKRNIYDIKWNLLDLTIKCPNDPTANIAMPTDYDNMIELAESLSKDLPQVRVDLYSVNGQTYFGELTLYHGSGYEKFTPDEYGYTFGSYIDLSLCEHEKGID